MWKVDGVNMMPSESWTRSKAEMPKRITKLTFMPEVS